MASDSEFFTEFKSQHNICATVCCICHKTLTDASSIEYGIGPVCRKNGNYDDAPALSSSQIAFLEEAIDAAFPEQLAGYLLGKVKPDSPATTRQIAKCTIYYASSIIGTQEAGRLIHCIRVLICMGYTQLAQRLLSKSYGHLLWLEEGEIDEKEAPKLFYKGPFNKLINSYLKSQFKGKWDGTNRHWILEGQLLDCAAMLVAAEVGDLKPLPLTPPKIEEVTVVKKKIPIKTKDAVSSDKETPPPSPEKGTPEKAQVIVKLTITDQTVSVFSPFNYKFKTQVKTLLEGQWDPSSKQWKVDLKHLEILKKLIITHYPQSLTLVV